MARAARERKAARTAREQEAAGMADDFKYHIDHAGGLVRPAAVVEARRARGAGRLDQGGLAEVTDEAIAEVAKGQRRIGLSAVTDGQYRRDTWASILYDGGEGFDGVAGSPVAGLLGEGGAAA